MPERKGTITVESERVQGEGSWVRVRRLTMGEIRGLRKAEGDTFELGESLVRERVVAWNWVDEKGQPLPQPGEAGFEGAWDGVTDQEFMFLSEAVAGSMEQRKN